MSTSVVQDRRMRWGQLRLSTKLCFLLLLLLLLIGFLELGSRVYWAAVKHTHGTSADAIWRTCYPEVAASGIDRVAPYHGDNEFTVLLLGASVLDPIYGNIGDLLGSELEVKLGRKVRVVNFSSPGRTSLDSRSKYEHFADKRFDLVLVYHGINDVFLNNCPPGSFRPDYSHAYRRFGVQRDLKWHPEVGWFALPFTAGFLANTTVERWGLTNTPRVAFEQFGNDVRTPPSFEANLEAIARAAEQRGDPLVLSTFAYYLPANYSLAAFKAKELDYGNHLGQAEAWAEPRNLTRTLDLHNEAVRRVAKRHGLTLIDQRACLPDGKRYYNDPCHLTDDGCARWVENVMSGLDLSKIGRADRR
jgi:lysophospholipase L1-like esterase